MSLSSINEFSLCRINESSLRGILKPCCSIGGFMYPRSVRIIAVSSALGIAVSWLRTNESSVRVAEDSLCIAETSQYQ